MRPMLLTFLIAACVAAAVGFGGWGLMQQLRRDKGVVPAQLVMAQLGSVRIVFDPAYARSAEDRGGGRADRLDFAAAYPSFEPAGEVVAARPLAKLIFLRIQAADATLAPEDRTSKLYVRFLEPEQWTNPGGLVMRRFEAGSPFEREELYYAPPEGRLFAARCMRPAQPPDGLPDTCVQDLRVDGLDVQMRFTPDLLPEWENLVAGARAILDRMTR